jgi:hypothetical protein
VKLSLPSSFPQLSTTLSFDGNALKEDDYLQRKINLLMLLHHLVAP